MLKSVLIDLWTDAEIWALIWRMNRENSLWGAPRIHGE
jgi:hypothetical protein